MDKLLQINVDKIKRDENQPRRTFDEISIMELKASIEAIGQITPITVIDNQDGYYIIVDGERRYRAISESKKITTADIIIKEYTPEESKVVQLLANWDREDIKILEKANFIETFLKDYCNGDKVLAGKKLGKSIRTINKILSIHNAHSDILNLVNDGYISDYGIIPKLNNLKNNSPEEFNEFVEKLKKGDVVNLRKELKSNPNTKTKKSPNTKNKFSKHKPRNISDINVNSTQVDKPILQISDADSMYQFRLSEEQAIKLMITLNNEFEHEKKED